jgi:hypothetical protein
MNQRHSVIPRDICPMTSPSKAHDQRLLRLRDLLQDIVQAAAAGLAQFLALAVPGVGCSVGAAGGSWESDLATGELPF